MNGPRKLPPFDGVKQGYVPVEASTGVVHLYADTRSDWTPCGQWFGNVRSILFVKPTDPHCPVCWPDATS